MKNKENIIKDLNKYKGKSMSYMTKVFPIFFNNISFVESFYDKIYEEFFIHVYKGVYILTLEIDDDESDIYEYTFLAADSSFESLKEYIKKV